MSLALDAGAVVANCLRTVEPQERQEMLRELMVHAGTAWAALEGKQPAAEAAYRLGDFLVDTSRSER